MQPVREFDQYHPDVVGQGEQHFPEILELLGGVGRFVVQSGNLGQPVYDSGHHIAEFAFYFGKGQARVFNGIVQEGDLS